MKRIILCLLILLCGTLRAQDTIPVSMKDLAPDFGLRPQFVEDTLHVARYLDSLPANNHALTDTCVNINAKLMAMENVLLYDYRHSGDTVWIDAAHYVEDYAIYSQRIKGISEFLLQRAHRYIQSEQLRKDDIQQKAVDRRRDTIDRLHRTIVNACDGIGVSDRDRKKELKDIYYAYLSVYNRYDFSMKRADSAYLSGLTEFSVFQQSVINNLLSNNNYTARINNFNSTLKLRCGHNHSEVLRSYQRVFRQAAPAPAFSTLDEYYIYLASLQSITNIQNSYLTVVELREKISASSKRIATLYSPKFRETAKTYQDVAATINLVPAFITQSEANLFISNLNEFIEVQDCYLRDYNRLTAIGDHGDSIAKHCSMKYSDVAKAYRQISEINSMTPKYQSLDDAARFGSEMDRFETIQQQFDTILAMRIRCDAIQDSINKGWMQHLVVYNGYQNIRKQYVLTPSFIDVEGGEVFIERLADFSDMQQKCLKAIRLFERYRQLDDSLQPLLHPFHSIRKAYSRLDKQYINIKAINHLSELYIYIQQLEAFITVQERLAEICKSDEARAIDSKVKGAKDLNQIEAILGL